MGEVTDYGKSVHTVNDPVDDQDRRTEDLAGSATPGKDSRDETPAGSGTAAAPGDRETADNTEAAARETRVDVTGTADNTEDPDAQ